MSHINLKTNYLYLIWIVIYIILTWLILGANWSSFLITITAYTISIIFSLSPAGELFFRYLKGTRKVLTREERERLTPIFQEVYENAKKQNSSLHSNIDILIIDRNYINAFAFGKKSIAITSLAFETFSDEELKGVLSHEFGHLSNGDTCSLLLTEIGNGFFTIFILLAHVFTFVTNAVTDYKKQDVKSKSDNKTNAILVIFILQALKLLINIFITLFLGLGRILLAINDKQQEFLADKFASKCGYTQELIDALYILKKVNIPPNMTLLERLQTTHPNLAIRIARLESLQENQ